MGRVVEAPCPSCKSLLRVPADWVNQTLRCKNCGAVIRVKGKRRSATLDAPPPPAASTGTVPTVPNPLAFDPNPGSLIVQSTPSRRHVKRLQPMAILVGILLLAAVVAGAYRYWLPVSDSGEEKPRNPKEQTAIADNSNTHRPPTVGPFPRRLLAISVNNYLFANPVSPGSREHNIHALVQQIQRFLHVPANQILVLSDAKANKESGTPSEASPGPPALSPQTEKAPDTLTPLKPILEKMIPAFLEGCRTQDCLLVLFVGHVVLIDTAAYLVPLEGELDAKETLIPVSWFYEQLARCRARQKAVILDTCRFDPSRGPERPGSGPMPVALDGLLEKPPADVQLWSACVAGQYSYEADGAGIFLDKLYDALQPAISKNAQEPRDPLPLDLLASLVNRGTATDVTSRIGALNGQKAVQTPRLTGQIPDKEAAYDPDEPLPEPIALPTPPLPSDGRAKPEQVRRILREIDLPPIKPRHAPNTDLEIEAVLPFSAAVIERYRPNYRSLGEIQQNADKYPLRHHVLTTIQLLRRDLNPAGPQGALREYFQGSSNERIKAEIFREQKQPAQVLSELTERLEELRKAGEQRDKEPSPRWQAHYDYILAELLARTAYVSEYNLMLGKIRKDELPELRSGMETGWRLVACEKMQSGKDVREMAAESKKLFAKLIKEYPGTPWQILAKREKLTALGLQWQPSS